MDSSAPRVAIEGAAASQRSLDDMLAGLGDRAPHTPSLLPNWTVGHVLTHLARNADGLTRMVEGAGRGESAEMYPTGLAGREADIEAGAGRSLDELVADVRRSAERLAAAFDGAPALAWEGTGMTLRGPVRIIDVPGRRRQEVEIHRVDLGLGYGFADCPADFVRSELSSLTGVWASRKPMGFSDLPATALALAPPDRLAWLLGRLSVDGLAPAGIFG